MTTLLRRLLGNVSKHCLTAYFNGNTDNRVVKASLDLPRPGAGGLSLVLIDTFAGLLYDGTLYHVVVGIQSREDIRMERVWGWTHYRCRPRIKGTVNKL